MSDTKDKVAPVEDTLVNDKSTSQPPSQTPHISTTAEPLGSPRQSSQSLPSLSEATQPQSLSHAVPPQKTEHS